MSYVENMSLIMARHWPPERIAFHFGDAIRKARELHDWTQQELAKKAKVNVNAVVRAEKNRSRDKTLDKIIAALGVRRETLEAAVTDRAGPSQDRKIGKMKELVQSMMDAIEEIDPTIESPKRASGE
jgi:transcriptional regulator with XRE-family HTH domain